MSFWWIPAIRLEEEAIGTGVALIVELDVILMLEYTATVSGKH